MRTLLLLSLLFAGGLFSEEKVILEIRNYYQAIQKNLKTYTQTKIDFTHKNSNTDETDLLEEQIYFYKNKNGIVRIVGDMVFDCSGKVNELTYKNKKLLFVYSYSWMGCNREGISEQNRYYFQNNQLIEWKQGEERPSSSSWKSKEKELLKLSKLYLNQMPK